MTIKEVEEQTGLPRSNIRFYEKENLVEPGRNEKNGYRDYSEEDVEKIKKVAYLRTLGISIEEIYEIITNRKSLYEVIEHQTLQLNRQIEEMQGANQMCQKLLKEKNLSFEKMDIAKYVPDPKEEWKKNQKVFCMDSVGFLYLWGDTVVCIALALVSLILAVISYRGLPSELPVQWSHGSVSSTANKGFIFAYPAACILIRIILRPYLWRWFRTHGWYSDIITDAVTNYLCLVAVTIQIFTILFVYGLVHSIILMLLTVSVLFLAMLSVVWVRTRNHTGKDGAEE